MPYFLEVPLGNGDTVLAEITGQVDDVAPFGRGKDVLGRLSGSFADGLEHVRGFAGEVLDCLKESCDPPDRVAVEFGLKFSATSGVVIAEVAGEGHIAVTVEWCRVPGSIGARVGQEKAEPVPASEG
jgi:NTP-dependent ternary system trypsin peptidase co-occuring protein